MVSTYLLFFLKGGGAMSTYEVLSLMIAFGVLIVMILGTKK